MVVRFSAAVVLTGLAFATPSHAGTDALSPEHFLDLPEADTAALIAADLATLPGSAAPLPDSANKPVAELPSSGPCDQPPEPSGSAELGGAAFSDDYIEQVLLAPDLFLGRGEDEMLAWVATDLALAPELFLDHAADETFSWIAADLAAAGELTTGSTVGQSAANPFLATEQSDTSLTDDALVFGDPPVP